MVAQLVFFSEFLKKKEKKSKGEKKKRIRYLIPTYKKVYSIYQYDQEKYMQIWDKIRELAIKLDNPNIFFNTSAYKILKLCYIKEDGMPKHLGDRKHIYRLPTLYKIQAHIFNYSKTPLNLSSDGEQKWEESGVIFFNDFYDGGFAEINGTDKLPIRKRVQLHINLLRYLRKGIEIGKAVKLCQMKPLK